MVDKGGRAMRKICMTLLIACLLSLNACSGERKKVENLVTMYNEVLIDALLKPDPLLMELFVTRPQLVRIDSYISLMLKRNRIMKAEIKSLDFRKVLIDKKTAEVHTDEEWVYTYLDARTRKEISPEYMVKYSNVYYLVRADGRWVVDRIDAREIEGTEREDKEEMRRLHKRLFEEMRK